MPTIDLIFEEPEGQLPMPHAWIAVRMANKNKAGAVLLTPPCTSLDEMDRQVRLLHEELDRALEEAKRRFAAQDGRE